MQHAARSDSFAEDTQRLLQQRLRLMFSQYLAPGYSSEVLHVYLGEDLTKTHAHPDMDEDIEVVPVKITDIEPMILDGRIKDAKTIAALLVALRLFKE